MDNNVNGNIAFTVDGMGNWRPWQFGIALPFVTNKIYSTAVMIIVAVHFLKDIAFYRTICISF